MTKEEKIICKDFLNDADETHSCNEYKLLMALLVQEPTTKHDLALIHTEGLDEGIRCAMCTNSMKSDRGCDGGCVINNAMYKKVMDVIENHVQPTTENDCENCIHNKGVLECDMYGCKYEPTTKNDLGVDWESYKDADGNCLDDLILEVLQNNFDCGNTYGYKVADEIIGLLPSVTPIRPKGHWMKMGDRGFGYSDIVICKCSECEYQTEFVGKFDGHNLVIDAERADNYCSNCGSDNSEVEE